MQQTVGRLVLVGADQGFSAAPGDLCNHKGGVGGRSGGLKGLSSEGLAEKPTPRKS